MSQLKIYDLATASWKYVSSPSQMVAVSDSSPVSPLNGALWWDTDDASLLVDTVAPSVLAADPAFTSRYMPIKRTGTYTPTLTNMSVGTGGSAANTCAWTYHDGLLTIDWVAILGTSGASVTGSIGFSLPAGFTCDRVSTNIVASLGVTLIAAGNYVEGVAHHSAAGTITLLARTASGTYVSRSAMSATVPATWAANDSIFVNGTIKGILV
jgi:hypothetical protein